MKYNNKLTGPQMKAFERLNQVFPGDTAQLKKARKGVFLCSKTPGISQVTVNNKWERYGAETFRSVNNIYDLNIIDRVQKPKYHAQVTESAPRPEAYEQVNLLEFI